MNEMGRRDPGGGEEEGLRQVQVPEGVQGLPPGVVYGLEWVTVSLPVLYRGEGEDWSGGVAQGGGAGAQGLLLPVLGGKLNAEL